MNFAMENVTATRGPFEPKYVFINGSELCYYVIKIHSLS